MIKYVIKTQKSKDRIRLYSILFFIGILVGIFCRLTDFFSYESLWSLPSIATLFGFWIASVSLITYCSSSNLGAFGGSFLYMFGMTVSFYTLKFLLGFFWERFSHDTIPCVFRDGAYLRYWKLHPVLLEQGKRIFIFTLCFACKRYAFGSNSVFNCALEAKNASWTNFI